MRFFARLSLIAFIVLSTAVLSEAGTEVFNGRPVVSQEILVTLNNSDTETVRQLRALLDSDVIRQVGPTSGNTYIIHSRSLAVPALVGLLANHPEVEFMHPNTVLKAAATPNDPGFPQLWALRNPNGPDIRAASAWDLTTGRTSATIGIVDTGIDYTHPDLAANVWTASSMFTVTVAGKTITCPAGSHGFNAFTMNCDPKDDQGHGTHVAGTIGAAGNNSVGVTGVNWTARMMGAKMLDSSGSGTDEQAINAIEFLIQAKLALAGTPNAPDIRVISASWGASGTDQALANEINRAAKFDILFVAAAGNAGNNNDVNPFYPASAPLANVIAVAATEYSDNLASFSNYGVQTVHLAAPGVGIYSTYQGGGYATMSGTSMATPHVSGAALLLLAACPNLTTAGLKAALLNNVDPVVSLSGKTITGGRLNVYRAITSCAASTSIPIALFSTGIGTGGGLLADGAVDPHYTLTSSADSSARGPNLYVVKSDRYPFPSWANSLTAKWIAPQADQSGGNAPGSYTYQTSFDLTGFNPATAIVSGTARVDDSAVIKLNGSPISSSPIYYGPGTFYISSGFIPGVNTLEFVVTNGSGSANPTGVQVDIQGSAVPTGAIPVKVALQLAPPSVTLGAGSTQQFTATVTGTSNTAVTWSVSPSVGQIINGLYAAPASITADQTITIKAVSQQDPSVSATAIVNLVASAVAAIPVYGTGMNAAGGLAADGATDLHYTLTSSADPSAPGPAAYVVYSDRYPLGTWSSGLGVSKWIAPKADQSGGNASGTYVYRTTFDLAGLKVATAKLTGSVYADDAVTVKLNGSVVSFSSLSYTRSQTFEVTSGFLPGVNVLEFVVTNGSGAATPTGLMVEIRGTAETGGTTPNISVQISPTTVTLGPTGVQQFAATVTGSANTAVNWSISPALGQVVNGVYTAPASISSNQVVSVTATSQADPSKAATATVNLVPIGITIAPSTVTLGPGGTQQFSASLTGASNTGVTWSLFPTVGQIVNGLYKAPATISATQTVAVIATSQQDSSKTAVGTVTLAPGSGSAVLPIQVYGTGVKVGGGVAADGSIDAHYTLSGSSDPSTPGPAAYVIYGDRYPMGIWKSGPGTAKWIGPKADASGGSLVGTYTYRTTFDLTGANPTTAQLSGSVMVDDSVTVKLNGAVVATPAPSYYSPAAFSIKSGFVTGVNTLEFVVTNAGNVTNPTGLLADVQGTVLSGSPSSIAVQITPGSATLPAGGAMQFSATVTGTTNTAVSWSLNPNVGQISNGYYVAPATIAANQTVLVTATSQQDPTKFATATISLTSASGTADIAVFSTGVAAGGGPAVDGSVDVHYTLVSSSDSTAAGPNAYVVYTDRYPIGAWLAGSGNGKWIAPQAQQNTGNQSGSYTYRTTFDLGSANPATAQLSGAVLADDSVLIRLNGAIVASPGGSYATPTAFKITTGFSTGVNTLDFVVTNGVGGPNPTGVLVDIKGTVAK